MTTTTTKLACGHEVALIPGAAVFNHYDAALGIIVEVPDADGWGDVRSLGGPFWSRDRVSSLNPDRLTCDPCGRREIGRRSGTISADGSWSC